MSDIIPEDDQVQQQPRDRQMVASLGRGLAILSSFRAVQPVLSNSELAAATGLPRPSVSRLTHTLVKLGYLEYDSEWGQAGGYRLGPRVLAMGYAMRGGLTLRHVAMTHLHDLAQLSNGLAGLVALQGHGMLMVEVVRAGYAEIGNLEAGVHTPLESTAMGRAYLASSSQPERDRLIALLIRQRGLDPEQLNAVVARACDEYRELGACTAIDSWRDGNCGAAVPLYLKGFGSRMVLTCGATRADVSAQRLREEIVPAVRDAARKIELAYERNLKRRVR